MVNVARRVGSCTYYYVVQYSLPLAIVKDQLEAAAGGRSEGLLGIAAEVVGHEAATGRGEWEGAATRHGRVGLMAGQQTRARAP